MRRLSGKSHIQTPDMASVCRHWRGCLAGKCSVRQGTAFQNLVSLLNSKLWGLEDAGEVLEVVANVAGPGGRLEATVRTESASGAWQGRRSAAFSSAPMCLALRSGSRLRPVQADKDAARSKIARRAFKLPVTATPPLARRLNRELCCTRRRASALIRQGTWWAIPARARDGSTIAGASAKSCRLWYKVDRNKSRMVGREFFPSRPCSAYPLPRPPVDRENRATPRRPITGPWLISCRRGAGMHSQVPYGNM